jgi:hypothetical protein
LKEKENIVGNKVRTARLQKRLSTTHETFYEEQTFRCFNKLAQKDFWGNSAERQIQASG